MSRLTVLNIQGEQVDDVDVSEALFMEPLRKGAIYYAAVAQLSRGHLGNASTKKRGEVRGGGRKPWAQKGTGRARSGTSRSPLWAGGGVIFGPTPERNYSRKVTKKVKRLALRSALSSKVREGKLLLVDNISLDEPKTKEIKSILTNLKAETRTLLVTAQPDKNIIKSVRNLPGVNVVVANQLSVVDILNHDCMVVTREALSRIEEVFSS